MIENYFGIPVKLVDTDNQNIIDEAVQVAETQRQNTTNPWSSDIQSTFKFDEYVRLHKIMSWLSNKSIWESLKNWDDIEEIIKECPDEMNQTIKKEIKKMKDEYIQIESEAKIEYEKVKDKTRKEIWIDDTLDYKHIIFSMLDKKDYEFKIWDIMKPRETYFLTSL